MLQESGLGSESKSLVVTGSKEGVKDEQEADYLEGEESKRFRAIAARLNYMAQDASDVQCACKEVQRHGETEK